MLMLRKTFMALLLVTVSVTSTTGWSIPPKPHTLLPHLDLEMSGEELNHLLRKSHRILDFQLSPQNENSELFQTIFRIGKRNLDWIRVLNENQSDKISLSTPETQQGFPIHKPRIYNPKLIAEDFKNLQENMPVPLKDVIFGTTVLPRDLPIDKKTYMEWGLAVDRIYQIAARWQTYQPYMRQLEQNSANDIRGFYFISRDPQLQERLKDWRKLSEQEKPEVRGWLIQVCRNNIEDKHQCASEVDRAIQNNKTHALFQRHRKASEQILGDMLYIPKDVEFQPMEWKSPSIAEVPFIDPKDQNMRSYLVDNIQQEWRFLPGFALHVYFVGERKSGVNVIWNPGVTPHVPYLGSNTIYMDANAPISEYDVQWTIRHEFGHVLGFPDCYLEFFDTDLNAIVGYQFDTTDLMCSRRGHLKERHVDELRRVYQADQESDWIFPVQSHKIRLETN